MNYLKVLNGLINLRMSLLTAVTDSQKFMPKNSINMILTEQTVIFGEFCVIIFYIIGITTVKFWRDVTLFLGEYIMSLFKNKANNSISLNFEFH